MRDFNRLWKGFWQLADPKIWIASTVPMFVGGALAYSNTGRFDFYWFIISLIGIYFIEIGKNAVNEFIDFGSGADRFIAPDKKTPFSGGKKTIVEEKLTVKDTKLIALGTIAAGCLIGLYVMAYREFSILWVGLLGVFFAVFYSLPPFKFAYNGLGELAVGITFGPLIVSGIYLVMTHTLDIKVIIASLPIGFLIANVLWINQYPDYEADLKANKRNWVVRLGKEKSVTVYKLLFACSYISFLIIAIVFKNPFWLLGFVTLPISNKAVKVARKYYDDIPQLIEANVKTVLIYQITGVIMILAAILGRVFQ